MLLLIMNCKGVGLSQVIATLKSEMEDLRITPRAASSSV